MKINSNFVEMLSALSEEKAEFLVVGGYAVAMHAEPRYTKDIDIWFKPTLANAGRVWRALVRFGAPMEGIAIKDMLDPEMILQIGVEPVRIDIIASISPLVFKDAKARAVLANFEGVVMPVIGLEDLVASKVFANRPQDRIDLRALRLRQKRDKKA